MLTVKVQTDADVRLYSTDRVVYNVHRKESLSNYYLEESNQGFVQTGGKFSYLGLGREPSDKPNEIYDFIELFFTSDDETIYLVFGIATVYIMNENGKTVDKISL